MISPLQQQGQWRAVSSRYTPCPSDQGYHCPVLLNSKPAELAPVCQLDASETASQWMSEAAAVPTFRTTSVMLKLA